MFHLVCSPAPQDGLILALLAGHIIAESLAQQQQAPQGGQQQAQQAQAGAAQAMATQIGGYVVKTTTVGASAGVGPQLSWAGKRTAVMLHATVGVMQPPSCGVKINATWTSAARAMVMPQSTQRLEKGRGGARQQHAKITQAVNCSRTTQLGTSPPRPHPAPSPPNPRAT